MRMRSLLSLLSVAVLAAGCSTVDLSGPEIPLPERYAAGAAVRLTSFEGSDNWGTPAEGPSLSSLRDQLSYGVVRCSRPGPDLDLEVKAAFVSPAEGDRLVGVATWRDPSSRAVVGRKNIVVEVDFAGGGGRRHGDRSGDGDGFGAWVPQGQLAAGEAFVGEVCRTAFGWSGRGG